MVFCVLGVPGSVLGRASDPTNTSGLRVRVLESGFQVLAFALGVGVLGFQVSGTVGFWLRLWSPGIGFRGVLLSLRFRLYIFRCRFGNQALGLLRGSGAGFLGLRISGV